MCGAARPSGWLEGSRELSSRWRSNNDRPIPRKRSGKRQRSMDRDGLDTQPQPPPKRSGHRYSNRPVSYFGRPDPFRRYRRTLAESPPHTLDRESDMDFPSRRKRPVAETDSVESQYTFERTAQIVGALRAAKVPVIP